jgi:NADH:ubiquinone oxidoreductase subunit C
MTPEENIKEKLADKIIAFEQKAPRRIYFDLNPEDIPEAARYVFKELGCRFVIASGVDTPKAFEILYHFSHDATGKMITLRTYIRDKENPQIETLTSIFRAAEWIEREMWEMLGIHFTNHPNLKRLLLAEDWPEGNYPLRKNES